MKQRIEMDLEKKNMLFVFILGIVFFVIGYLASANILEKPVSDSQLKWYEQIALDVYNQGNKAIYEVPDGVSLERTSESIIISSDSTRYRGKVIATLQNGELVYTRDLDIFRAYVVNFNSGILFAVIGTVFSYELMTRKKA